MNCKMSKWLTALAAVAVFAASATRVQATSLAPGQSGVVPDNNAATGVTVKADTGWINFTTPGGTTGSVREMVVTDSSNALGGLDFMYQVKVTGGDPIQTVKGLSFTNFKTDVGQVATQAGTSFDTGTVKATDTQRTLSGQTVQFNFGNNLVTGSVSYVTIIRTDASSWIGGTISVTDGGTLNFTGFAPNPEPTSLVLLGGCLFGLGGAGALRRWRKGAPVVN